jgi:hypothetical protein
MAKGIKFGRKPKLSDYQRQEAIERRADGETLAFREVLQRHRGLPFCCSPYRLCRTCRAQCLAV